jgi:nucleotide-binding universal stress UspA family protein/predicted transcriptional regulator
MRAVPWPSIPANEFGGFITAETYDDVLAADQQAAREHLGKLQSELARTGLSVATAVRDGNAAQNVMDMADELGAHAIVMATHGRGGPVRLVMGSVAELVLKDATVPLLLVHTNGPERGAAFQKILVPLDGSRLAERAIDQARSVLPELGSLVLTRVVEPIYEVFGDEVSGLVIDEAATVQAEAEARAYLDRVAEPILESGVSVLSLVHRGRAATDILEAARRAMADAIVMTTHGHTGPTRWLMGSVADEVSRQAEQPVFLISVRTVIEQVTGAYSVKDLMTRQVEYVTEDETIVSVLKKLLRRRASGAPVVNERGSLIGVITEMDLLNWHRRTTEAMSKSESDLDPAQYGDRIENETIATLVTRPAIAIDVDADLNAAVRMLTGRGVRRLPVTDNGRLVGIISRSDILKGMAEHWSSIKEPARV